MKLLTHLNVLFAGHDNNIKTDCIWCGSSTLSIDEEPPHQFSCFKCKQSGNAFTYIRRWYDNLPALKKSEAIDFCNLKKGVKPTTLREVGTRFYDGCYWFPVYNLKKLLVAIHKFVPETNIVYSSPKPTNYTILGVDRMTKSDACWVAEGPFDYFTLLPYMKDTGIDLIATCGSYFASSQLSLLKGRHIVLLYDNDMAGKLGIEHVSRAIKTQTIQHLSISYLDWSKVTPPTGELTDKYDIRDLHNSFAGAV